MKIQYQEQWAKSAENKNIELYMSPLGHNPENKDPFLFIGGVHGDEPEGVELATELLKWLHDAISQSRTLHPWILIPCLNPDGYSRGERTNGNGVDLNRNFPTKDWSPENKAPRYFPGTGPASEPETKALVALIKEVRPKAIIHFHSWEPCIVYTHPSAKKLALLLAEGNNYEVREDIGYTTPGSLGDYGGKDQGIPVVCIEEKEHTPLEQVWPHFAQGLKKILNFPLEVL